MVLLTAFASDAIFVDEIGIEIGVYGDYRLKSLYQPIFARRGGSIVPVAVAGMTRPEMWSQPVSADRFLADVRPEDALFVESLCRALHLRNYRNIGVDGLDLFFAYDPRVNRDLKKSLTEIAFLARRLGEIGLDPALLVCEVAEAAALDEAVLVQLAAALRSQGIRIAIDNFGLGSSAHRAVGLLRPDIARIDGPLLRTMAAEASTARLLEQAVRALRSGGVTVMAEGIETPRQLRVALEAGADLLKGSLLGAPALVGTLFDEKARPLAPLLEADSKVVPLFGHA